MESFLVTMDIEKAFESLDHLIFNLFRINVDLAKAISRG